MRWSGTLVWEDLGPGLWVLDADDGKRYALEGELGALDELKDSRVIIEGSSSQRFGLAMVGSESIRVGRIRGIRKQTRRRRR